MDNKKVISFAEQQLIKMAEENGQQVLTWQYGRNPRPNEIMSNDWVVRPAGEFPHGAWIADVGRGEVGEMNARAIAAIPEMIEALKYTGNILMGCDEYKEDDALWSCISHIVRALHKLTDPPVIS